MRCCKPWDDRGSSKPSLVALVIICPNTSIIKTSIMPVLTPRLYLGDPHENNQWFFSIVQLLHNCIWACLQSEKHFYIRRYSKVISHINHLSYILPKSLIMTWRSLGKLSKHSFARLFKISAKNFILSELYIEFYSTSVHK